MFIIWWRSCSVSAGNYLLSVHPLIYRQSVQRDPLPDPAGSFQYLPFLIPPLAFRQRDGLLAVFCENRGYKKSGSQHKLSFFFGKALIREGVFHTSDDGLA